VGVTRGVVDAGDVTIGVTVGVGVACGVVRPTEKNAPGGIGSTAVAVGARVSVLAATAVAVISATTVARMSGAGPEIGVKTELAVGGPGGIFRPVSG
jgi:hypothetical protein